MAAKLIGLFVLLTTMNAFADSRNLETCFVQNTAELNLLAPLRICMNDIGLYNDGDHEWVVINAVDQLPQGYYDLELLGGKTYAVKVVENNDDGVVCGSTSTKKLMLELPENYKTEITISNLKVTFVTETLNDTCHSHPYTEEVSYKLQD